MFFKENMCLLKIYIEENSKYENRPIFEWIMEKAHENKMIGATLFRGMEGFGANGEIHRAKILSLSLDLPIVLEIVDTEKKIKNFLPIVDEAVKEGLVTIQKIYVHSQNGKRTQNDKKTL